MKLLHKYRNFLVDCDGVLWNGNAVIASSVDAINRLMEQGKNVVFVTNNSTKSRRAYCEKFSKLGFNNISENLICSSSSYAAEVCLANKFNPVFVIGEKGLVDELELVGIRVTQDESSGYLGDEEFKNMQTDSNVKAVVVGWDRSFNYRKLCHASMLIQAGASFVATNTDPYDTLEGRNMPGNGCMVSAIQCSVDDIAGKNTIVTGKPNPDLLQFILGKHHFNPQESIMIGDRLDTDMQFASGVIDSLLVFTGCTQPNQLNSLSENMKPTYATTNLISALEMEI